MPLTWWITAALVPAFAVGALRAIDRGGADRRALQVAVLATAATLAPSLRDHGIVAAVLGLSIPFVAWATWISRRLDRSPLRLRALRRARAAILRGPPGRFALGLALVTFTLCWALSWLLFRGIPVIQDTQAQLFHAEILASGRLVAPSPPAPDFFYADHVIVHHGFYSQYPPGHTVLLLLGVLAGVPSAVNPALGAIGLVLVHACGRELFGERTGRRAALLGLASPFVVFMSSEYMNHATAMALFGLQVLAIARTLRTGSLGWALVAGVAVGWQILVRPITAVGLGAPLAILVLVHAWRAPRKLALPTIVMAIAAAAIGALMLPWNAGTTGDPRLMGYIVRWGPEHTLGFGISPWGDPHTPADGLEHTLSNLNAWNMFLFGGPLPALLLVALGVARDRRRPIVLAMAAAPALVLAIYFFYFFQDLTFGPRYLYEANVFALLAASRGIGWLPELLPRLGLATRRAVARGLVPLLVLSASAFALVGFVPGIVHEYAVGYALHGGVVDQAYARIPTGRAVVLCDGAYQRAFYAVDPDLEARILFARDLGDERNVELQCAMPDREAWIERDHVLRRLPPVDCSGRGAAVSDLRERPQ